MTNSLKGLGIKDPYVGQPYAGKPEHTTKPQQNHNEKPTQTKKWKKSNSTGGSV